MSRGKVSSRSDRNETTAFLEALFTGTPCNLYIHLQAGPEKQSTWCQNVKDAVRHAESHHDRDFYVGVGFASRDYGPTQHCPSKEIAGIVCIWAVIDLRSGTSPKSTLPATIEQALTILPAEFPPSIVIKAGDVVYVLWLFHRAQIFENDNDRNAAATTVSRWQTLLRDNASQEGWTYKSGSDLTAVLRLPGTADGTDPENPKPALIHTQSDIRFDLSDFTEYLDELGIPDQLSEKSAAQKWAERFENIPLKIKLSARITDETLDELAQADPRFRDTWFRQRGDLPDQSQNSYDLALASIGYDLHLPDQKVIDLIIHHRALHKHKACTTIDYYQRTLSKAANRSMALPGSTTVPAILSSGAAEGDEQKDPARTRIDLCRQLSAAFGVEILRIVKLCGKEPMYRVELPGGKIEFSSVGKFIGQDSFLMAIAGRVGKFIPKFKAKDWHEIAQCLLDACIIEQTSEEVEYEGAALMHIRQYLSEATFIPSIEGQLAPNLRKPMVRDGRITICASDLQMFISKVACQNLAVREVTAMLSVIGANSSRIRGPKIREQSRWELPLEEFDPGDYSISEDGGRRDDNE